LRIIVGYIVITVTFTVSMENISDDDEDYFLRSPAALAVTIITIVYVPLNFY